MMTEDDRTTIDDASHADRVVVEMWADAGCPWCYLGKHWLRTAIAERADADRFDIVLRSFPLDPDAPTEPERNEDAYLRSHAGSPDDLRRAEQQMQDLARSEGLEYSVDRMTANTLDLHRLVRWAEEQATGRGFALFSRIQDGLFTRADNLFARDALVRAAESVGLDAEHAREVLAGDAFADAVHADREEAVALGATGVPFVVVDRRMAAPGARTASAYSALLTQAVGAPTEHRTGADSV